MYHLFLVSQLHLNSYLYMTLQPQPLALPLEQKLVLQGFGLINIILVRLANPMLFTDSLFLMLDHLLE
jgi:hypothetical protein